MADSGPFTATLRLTVGDLKVAHAITVPSAAVPATEVVPALQELVNAVVAAAEMGKTISCRKGCGACCRQLVPISRTEGERLLQLIEAMPAGRRQRLNERFAAAERTIERANLFSFPPIGGEVRRAGYAQGTTPPHPSSPPSEGEEKRAMTDRELSLAYFALRVPCPFLEDESCSIHAERPLVCREYLVTSPPELCAGPAQEGVRPVAVPKVSPAARRLQDDEDDWFPLALLMEFGRSRPRDAQRRPGPEWIERFLKRMTRS